MASPIPAPPIPVPASLSRISYSLSALGTLLWVGCVMPAGPLAEAGHGAESATPFHREGLLLVPALLLLVLLPVGLTLARKQRGLLALLAATDAFVALYASTALLVTTKTGDVPTWVLTALLLALGVLSLCEVVRCTRARPRPLRWRLFVGARLGLCLLVLMTPPDLLLANHTERASLLAPFLIVGISAAGALLAQSPRGLRATSALIQIALAIHLLVSMRYTLEEGPPRLAYIGPFGQASWWLTVGVAALATLQLVVVLAHRTDAPAVASADPPAPEAPSEAAPAVANPGTAQG